jgi:hypothetical protein
MYFLNLYIIVISLMRFLRFILCLILKIITIVLCACFRIVEIIIFFEVIGNNVLN